MVLNTIAVGSIDALRWVATMTDVLGFNEHSDVVLVPTAAAFTGATQAAVDAGVALDGTNARIEALMVTDRSSANEAYFARRVGEADWVILLDGSPLHARSSWRASAVGDALSRCARLIAVGATMTVIGSEMIDPRGGAPTTGLSYRSGAVLATASSDEQMQRTRELLGDNELLIVVGPDGVIGGDGEDWFELRGPVSATRGDEQVKLASLRTQ